MAAELVETSRLWGRIAARIEPDGSSRWPVTWSSAATASRTGNVSAARWWPTRRSRSTASRSSRRRKVDYGTIDPELSRELFIRHALVEGDWETRHAFFQANRALLDDVEELEDAGPPARHPGRRRDPVRLLRPARSRRGRLGPAFRHAGGEGQRAPQPDLLDFKPSMLITGDGRPRGGLPRLVAAGRLWRWSCPTSFEPGADADGVTVTCRCRCSTSSPPRLRLAGARTARGAGRRVAQVAAQAAAPPVGTGARPRQALVADALRSDSGSSGEPLLDALERELAESGVPVLPGRLATRPGSGRT